MNSMRLKVAILGVMLSLSFTAYAPAATEEFIWQDRWRIMGWEFQFGYAAGIHDLVFVLFDLEASEGNSDPSLPQGITGMLTTNFNVNKAHLCLNSKPITEIKQATSFVNSALASRDPQDSVAAVMLAALVRCDASDVGKLDHPTGMAQWKDRWSHEREQFQDGYASGVVDLIRHLDNAGKSFEVLRHDIVDAVRCIALTQKMETLGKFVDFTNRGLKRHTDPLESTSGAIFEVLRACKRF